MKSCGEKITDLTIIEKVLRTLNPKFGHIVAATKESRNLEILKVEELQGSLKSHEQRLLERSGRKAPDQALKAQTYKKKKPRGRGKGHKGRVRDRVTKDNPERNNETQEQFRTEQDVPESLRRGGYKGHGKKQRLTKRHLSVSIAEGLIIFHLNFNTQSRIRIMEDKAMKQMWPRKQIQKMLFSC